MGESKFANQSIHIAQKSGLYKETEVGFIM